MIAPLPRGSVTAAGAASRVAGVGRRRGRTAAADRDLALHAPLLVAVDRAVELVLAVLAQVDLDRLRLAGLNRTCLRLAARPLDLEGVRGLAVVLDREADLALLHLRRRRSELELGRGEGDGVAAGSGRRRGALGGAAAAVATAAAALVVAIAVAAAARNGQGADGQDCNRESVGSHSL